jgi:hypothetical protein
MEKLEIIHVPQVKDLTKTQIEITAEGITSAVFEGFEDALELDLKLKFMEETIKAARAKIDSTVRGICETTPEKFGVKISIRSGYTIYDYEKDKEYSVLKAKLKEREELLKEAAKSKNILVTAEGEQVEKPPVKSYTKDSFSYTFPK